MESQDRSVAPACHYQFDSTERDCEYEQTITASNQKKKGRGRDSRVVCNKPGFSLPAGDRLEVLLQASERPEASSVKDRSK
jgi:hypothetical protein